MTQSVLLSEVMAFDYKISRIGRKEFVRETLAVFTGSEPCPQIEFFESGDIPVDTNGARINYRWLGGSTRLRRVILFRELVKLRALHLRRFHEV